MGIQTGFQAEFTTFKGKNLAICGFSDGKIKQQGIVLLRNKPISAPMRKPRRGGYMIAAAPQLYYDKFDYVLKPFPAIWAILSI